MKEKNKKVNECLLLLQKHGTAEYVEALYDLIGPTVRHIGLKYIHDPDLTDDFVQDFWADIFKITDQYIFSFNAYGFLCKAATNRAIDYYRRRKRETAHISYVDYGQWQPGNHEADMDRQMLVFSIEHALQQLQEVQRIIIQSTYFEEKTVRQIAAELNMSKSQVDRLKKQALEQLRLHLEINQEGALHYERE